MHPMLGGVVVEGQQLVEVIGDLGCGLGELRTVGGAERLHGGEGMLPVLGIPDLGEDLLRDRVGGLRQRGEDVGDLVEPAETLPGLGEYFSFFVQAEDGIRDYKVSDVCSSDLNSSCNKC